MQFGYLSAHTNVPLQNLSDIDSSAIIEDGYLIWSASENKWIFSSSTPGSGDVFGIGSSTTDGVVIFSGTTGKTITNDSSFLYDSVSDTLYANTIEKAPIAATDFNITTVAGGDITVSGYTGTSAGGVNLYSGNATGTGKNGATVSLTTQGTIAGSINLEGGLSSGETGAPYLKINGPNASNNGSVIFRGGSKGAGVDPGYLTFQAGNGINTLNGGWIDIRGGSSSGSGTAGEISIECGGIEESSATGGSFSLSSNAITCSAGDGDTSGGNCYIESGSVVSSSGVVNPVTGGSCSYFHLDGATSSTNASALLSAGYNTASGTVSTLASLLHTSRIFLLGDGALGNPYLYISALSSTNYIGNILIEAGDTVTGTRGGNISFTSGSYDDSGSGTDNNGGALNIYTNNTTNGPTGDITITSGNGGSGTGGSGGAITIEGGASTLTGGGVTLEIGGIGSSTSGPISVTAGDGGTTGGSITIAAGDGTTPGDLKIETNEIVYFWPTPASPNIYSILMAGSVNNPATDNVTLSFITPDADTIFELGTRIIIWNNYSGLPSGVTTTGSVSIVGTLGTNAQVYLQLTPNSTSQNGVWQYDARNSGDYNTSYSTNWEFRACIYSSAIQGVNSADGIWFYAQSDGGVSGNSESQTNGVSVFFDEYNGGSLRHIIKPYVAATAQTTSYLGSSIGGSYRMVRIRKQGLELLIEMSGTGGYTSGYPSSVSRQITLSGDSTNTNAHYIGMGARTGGATALHTVSTFEFRQFPDNVPIVRKY